MRLTCQALLQEMEQPSELSLRKHAGRQTNRLASEDRAVHDWYRFVLAFPPHLVRTYLQEFGIPAGRTLLDPFCGTGTTLVVGKEIGSNVIGFEANPMAHLAASVKTTWDISADRLLTEAQACADAASRVITRAAKLRVLPPEAEALLLRNSICPVPLHKSLVLADEIEQTMTGAVKRAAQVALASTLVQSASNLHFGPRLVCVDAKRMRMLWANG